MPPSCLNQKTYVSRSHGDLRILVLTDYSAATVVHIANVIRGLKTAAARLLPSEVFNDSSQLVRTPGVSGRGSQ